jgi:hypothetical protein
MNKGIKPAAKYESQMIGEINPGEVNANSNVFFTFYANIHTEDSNPHGED